MTLADRSSSSGILRRLFEEFLQCASFLRLKIIEIVRFVSVNCSYFCVSLHVGIDNLARIFFAGCHRETTANQILVAVFECFWHVVQVCEFSVDAIIGVHEKSDDIWKVCEEQAGNFANLVIASLKVVHFVHHTE